MSVLNKINLEAKDLTVERYKPGSSGEALLYNELIAEAGVTDD
jgi:hypothetical protein